MSAPPPTDFGAGRLVVSTADAYLTASTSISPDMAALSMRANRASSPAYSIFQEHFYVAPVSSSPVNSVSSLQPPTVSLYGTTFSTAVSHPANADVVFQTDVRGRVVSATQVVSVANTVAVLPSVPSVQGTVVTAASTAPAVIQNVPAAYDVFASAPPAHFVSAVVPAAGVSAGRAVAKPLKRP